MQLVQLQERRVEFETKGWAIVAVSYDDVPTVAAFARKYGIDFPLLADKGSHVIRALGLENEYIAEQHAVYRDDEDPELNAYAQGSAYPGIFVLDRKGVIVEKRFDESYRIRPTASVLAEEVVHAQLPAAIETTSLSPGVQVQVWTADPGYWSFQQLLVHVTLTIKTGLHVYGQPIPEGYAPLEIGVSTQPPVDVGSVVLPVPRPFRMLGLDEEFFVYEGTLDVTVPVTVTRTPQDRLRVRVEVGYQACAETFCHPPTRRILELEIPGLDVLDPVED